MRFIDLFSGLGGFHVGLKKNGHECVFASEIDTTLIKTYEKNFGIKPHGDIRKIDVKEIPQHDILCAGFPCTPFSKAGNRKGLRDETNGDLFDEIIRILNYHKPKYFILENVASLYNHDEKETWSYIKKKLKTILGYNISKNFYSPHEFGIPQNRKRIFIVGSIYSLEEFTWIDKYKINKKTTIQSILYKNEEKKISEDRIKCISVWQKFLDLIPETEKLLFPIWAAEFGATYPYKQTTPFKLSNQQLGKHKGSFGVPLKGLSYENKFVSLPSYARRKENKFPDWKIRFIQLNRELYQKHKTKIDKVLPEIINLKIPSWQKFEWNCGKEERKLNSKILQFRSSGLRAKNIETAPSLVCPSTQIPIIGWEQRYLSRKEALKLHSLEELEHLPEYETACFHALGNAVNAHIVNLIIKELIKK